MLSLERCEGLTSVGPLAELTRLESLSLALCCRLTGLSRLSRASRHLDACPCCSTVASL